MPTVSTTIRSHARVVEQIPHSHALMLGMLTTIDQWADNEFPRNPSSGKPLSEIQMTEANVLLDLKNFLGGMVIQVLQDAGEELANASHP